MAEAERLARLLGMTPVRLPAGAKVRYHAGAVVASNYVVTLAGVAARFAAESGLSRDLAERIYLPLLAGAAANLQESSPADALTGPIRRGDVETVRMHLGALGGEDRRLYATVGLEAVRLARAGGLEPAIADQLQGLLSAALE